MALFFYQLINTYLQQKYKIELEESNIRTNKF